MDAPWYVQLLTLLGTTIGGGGIATIALKWMDNRKEEKTNLYQSTLVRISDLEKRDHDCNSRVTELEIKNRSLERECGRLSDKLLRIEDNLITAVITADSRMKIVKWNSGAVLLFGYLETEVLGADADILVPGNMKQQHHDAYERAVNDLDANTNWKRSRAAMGVHKDGHEFPIMLLISSFKNSNGDKFFEARITRPRTGWSGEHDAIIE